MYNSEWLRILKKQRNQPGNLHLYHQFLGISRIMLAMYWRDMVHTLQLVFAVLCVQSHIPSTLLRIVSYTNVCSFITTDCVQVRVHLQQPCS